jgi:hypothetical protein
MSLRSHLVAATAALTISITASAEIKPGQKSPDFAAQTLGGESLRLSSLQGKVVALIRCSSPSCPIRRRALGAAQDAVELCHR